MDKKIVDKLIQFGLITNIGVDANKYTDVDDLIAKGIVTIPGAKSKIMELIGDDYIVIEELPVKEDAVVDVADTRAVDTPIEEEVVVEEVVEDVEPAAEVVEVSETIEPEVEVVVEETEVVKEAPTKSEKKSSRSTKNQ
jgi:hypothetical protein